MYVKYPKRQTLRQSLCHNLHSRCLCLTLLIYLCMAVVFWCQINNWRQTLIALKFIDKPTQSLSSSAVNQTKCKEGLITVSMICMVIFYITYAIECWHCSSRYLLLHGKKAQDVYNYIDQMRQAKPIIWWKAASYHYVRYNQSVTCHLDGQGSSTSATTYKKRIDTHYSSSCFLYKNLYKLQDVSDELAGLEIFPITRIKFCRDFVFADETSAKEFDRQRSNFFRSNFKMDKYLEIREGIDLDGINYQECMITVGDSQQYRYWYCNTLAFWIFSLILLSWPLRILLEYNTAYVNYRIVKLFDFLNNRPNNDNHSARPCLLTHVTMDSLSNYTIAPSYSEAILIDQIQLSCNGNFAEKEETNTEVKSKIANKIKSNLNNLPSYEEVIRSNCDDHSTRIDGGLEQYLVNLFETLHGTTLEYHSNNLKRSLTSSFNHEIWTNQSNYKPWGSLQNVANL